MLLSLIAAGAVMTLCSFLVINNALRLRRI